VNARRPRRCARNRSACLPPAYPAIGDSPGDPLSTRKHGADGRNRTGDLLITKGTRTPGSDANLRIIACNRMQAAAWGGTQHGTTHPRRTLTRSSDHARRLTLAASGWAGAPALATGVADGLASSSRSGIDPSFSIEAESSVVADAALAGSPSTRAGVVSNWGLGVDCARRAPGPAGTIRSRSDRRNEKRALQGVILGVYGNFPLGADQRATG